ncbi:hypothetical protein CYMTET_53864 [Cymbomonas tetramitiformis]|uniref:EF-hand domain-containing protein n=1 Tax=Cymbomonas tetramitiformis TaxID=36881 RepID=A0AAE0BG15_9CHLO|nr:hypothetical protein CYMTET_53864 [Cymbomonas tetramitiformis]|eukprot:gene8279-9833_t
MEKWLWGKELWEVMLDGEDVPADSVERLSIRNFLKSDQYSKKMDGLFDQFDTDHSGTLDEEQLNKLLHAVHAALSGEKIFEKAPKVNVDLENKMKEDVHSNLKNVAVDKETFSGIAKMMVANMLHGMAQDGADLSQYQTTQEVAPSAVVIEELK